MEKYIKSNHQQKLLSLVVLFVVVWWILFFPQKTQALGITNLEQQINISNGEFSTQNQTDSPSDNSLGLVSFDSTDYSSDSVYFEVVVKCVDCDSGTGNNQVSARLYNDSGTPVSSPLTTTQDTYQRLRSGSLSLSTDNYTVRFQCDDDDCNAIDGGTAYIKAARLIVDQSAQPITDTQTQIELGHYENTNATGATNLSSPKYYIYDHDQYSGTVNAYFEATLKSSGNSTTATYYFNAVDGTQQWTNNPSYMADGDTGNYTSTSTDTDVQLLTANQNSGTDLGTITKVELRAYTYQTGDSSGSITLRPVFSGTSDGDNHNITPPEDTGEWSSYVDITTDTNAPSSWTWTDIQNLDADIVWNQNTSTSAYVSQVDIRVTYDDDDQVAYAQLYNRTDSQTVTESIISTSRSTPQILRSSALSTNWDTSNDDTYEVHLYTNHGSYPVAISNAKLIIDQTEATGIQKTEVIHHYTTSNSAPTSNTVYTQQSYLNQFDPDNFSNNPIVYAFFESTIKTSTAGTSYAALYNDSGSDLIDTSTNSEITTTSTLYELKRSSNLSFNSDWPSSAKDLDSVIKADTSDTTTISSAWLVIQTRAIEPTFTFTISGIGSGSTNNGVTTTVATSFTTIPFGHISVAEPAYAAHQIDLSTNDVQSQYTVQVKLDSPMQGIYAANHIDPFTGSGATWTIPQNWTSPDGTTPNEDTGWIGANTSDTDVTGWNNGSGKFGPLGTDDIEVARSNTGQDETIYVSYGIEVNQLQPADTYATQLIYTTLPVY